MQISIFINLNIPEDQEKYKRNIISNALKPMTLLNLSSNQTTVDSSKGNERENNNAIHNIFMDISNITHSIRQITWYFTKYTQQYVHVIYIKWSAATHPKKLSATRRYEGLDAC